MTGKMEQKSWFENHIFKTAFSGAGSALIIAALAYDDASDKMQVVLSRMETNRLAIENRFEKLDGNLSLTSSDIERLKKDVEELKTKIHDNSNIAARVTALENVLKRKPTRRK